MRASAYSRSWRLVAGLLVLMSYAGVLAIAAALVLLETRLDNPLRLLRSFVLASAAPGLAAWLLARAFAATVTIADGMLVIRRRDQRVEVPLDSIVAVVPWRVPLPGPGVELALRSGRRLPLGLCLDPIALMHALAAAASASVLEAARTPAAIYASSRQDQGQRWWRPLLEFAGFALVPTIPIFRLHQWIVYGGTFGEYYTYGLQAYLLAFLASWWTFTIYLVLWAAVLRAVAEGVVAATAFLAPARVARVRRVVEILDRVAYYGAVPLFLLRVAMLTS